MYAIRKFACRSNEPIPSVGRVSPTNNLSSVVFPAPFAPTMTTRAVWVGKIRWNGNINSKSELPKGPPIPQYSPQPPKIKKHV